MGKFRVNVTFNLAASVEPDGSVGGLDGVEGVLEVSDESSYYGESVSVSGGDVWITLEAEDEDQASSLALDLFESNARYSSYGSDLEFEIEDASVYSVEELEEPMTFAKALAAINAWLDHEVQSGRLDEETRQAIDFLLTLAKERQAQLVATRI